MVENELSILLICFGILALGYTQVMPKVAKSNLTRLLIVDGLMLLFIMIGAGVKFSGLDIQFSLLMFRTNWFVFTLVAYCVVECPFALWYMKKYRINEGGDD